MDVTVVILTCLYKDQEFIRIGYYVHNEYCEEIDDNKIIKPEKIIRNILHDKPRVTRFNIGWDNDNKENSFKPLPKKEVEQNDNNEMKDNDEQYDDDDLHHEEEEEEEDEEEEVDLEATDDEQDDENIEENITQQQDDGNNDKNANDNDTNDDEDDDIDMTE